MNPLRFALPLATALFTAAAAAQLPSWSTRPFTAPTSIFAESSIVVVQDAQGIHTWSSYSRAWTDLNTSPSAVFHGFDDHCVVVDGNMAWGYATRTGRWEGQPLNGAVTVPPPASGPVWVTAVVDGADVHMFSGLAGTWASTSFAAAPTVEVGRMAMVLSDGTRTVGYSALYGEAVDLGIGGTMTIDAVGYCGYARQGNFLHFFSAHRNGWHSIAANPAATVTLPPSRAGYLVVRDQSTLLFWSAMTDDQILLFVSPSATVTLKENVAAVQDGNTLFGYSCSAGGIDVRTSATGWQSVSVQQELILAYDASDLYAFGLTDGAFVSLPGTFVVYPNFGAALAISLQTGDYYAFSAMTNQWVQAPIGAYSDFRTTYNGVILIEQNGNMQGFSSKRAQWFPQTAPVADALFVHKAAFCARSGNRLDSFNGRTGDWATTTTNAPAAVTCFDMAVYADDGTNVHCYSCYVDGWTSSPVVPTQHQLRDECAYAYDGTTMHTWSGSGQVSEWANVPEYWRLLARGGRANYDISGFPGELAVLLVSTGLTSLATPWGQLYADPTVGATALVPIPPVGTGKLSVQVPDSPALRGINLFAQALIFSLQQNDFYLSNYYESTIL